MVKFCLINRFGVPYAIFEIICTDCNWMGELKDLVCDDWGDPRLCPKCGSDDTDEFDDGVYDPYIHMPTEWGAHHHDEFGNPIRDIDSMPKLIWKMIWRKIRRLK